ncbi:MAG: RDD family protein [Planctomycetota bacterium]
MFEDEILSQRDDQSALDTRIGVITPENIAFDYQLAGPVRRLPAFLIDLFTRWMIIVALVIVLVFVIGLVQWGTLGPFAVAAGMISYFLISWFYGAGLETFFNGRTVGKWVCGIRVIDVDGCPITGRRAVIRNLLRIADLAPMAALSSVDENIPPMFMIPTGMCGLLCMIGTRRMQRLGDLAAGTMVIIDERSWRLPTAKIDDSRVAPLSTYIPPDYRVSRSMARTLATYAERRHYLTQSRRHEIARHLAIPLIERFGFRHDLNRDLLIMALYYRTFLWDPNGKPIDLGPLAGKSPYQVEGT